MCHISSTLVKLLFTVNGYSMSLIERRMSATPSAMSATLGITSATLNAMSANLGVTSAKRYSECNVR